MARSLTLRRCALLVVCSIVGPAAVSASERPVASSPAKPAPASVAVLHEVPPPWLITANSVGPLRLGDAPPEPPAGFAASYVTDFFGEGYPLEGFQFKAPAVIAYVDGGPFVVWGDDHPGANAPKSIRKKAIQLARAGRLKIGMLVVTDPRPKTAQGIGVGDTYTTFARAYPKATPIDRFIGVWEEPSCQIVHADITFYFDQCDPRVAKLIRITIEAPQERP